MKLSSFFVCINLMLVLSSCTEKVDVELKDSEEKVVIEANIFYQQVPVVKISKMAPYFSSEEPKPVTDAFVEISDGTDHTVLEHDGGGWYHLQPIGIFFGDTGKTYHLKVIVEGKEYRAKSHLYPCIEVDTALKFEYRKAEGFIHAGYTPIIQFTDNRDDEVFTELNYSSLYYQQRIIRFSNANLPRFTRQTFEIPFFRMDPGDMVVLRFASMGKAEADYFNALDQLNSEIPGPFRSPPANPPTNIEGGAIGYFLASHKVHVQKTVTP